MSNEHKFEHNHEYTNVDPCWYLIQYTPLQPREKSMSDLTDTQGLRLIFHKVLFYPCDYNDMRSNMVETTWLPANDVNRSQVRGRSPLVLDSQGTLVQSIERE